jgi:hypothetical protein
MTLPVMQFVPSSCHFIPLRSKYSSQRHDVPSEMFQTDNSKNCGSTPETCLCCVLEVRNVRSGVVLRQHKRGRAVGPPSAQYAPWHFARRSSCCCCCYCWRRTGLRRPSGRAHRFQGQRNKDWIALQATTKMKYCLHCKRSGNYMYRML